MNHFTKIFVFFTYIMIIPKALCVDTNQKNLIPIKDGVTLKAQIEQSIQDILPNASVGILVQDANTGEIFYEKQSHELFPPASAAKVFTAASGLRLLGADYTYATTVMIDKNQLKQGKLQGDLYIQFSGDPSFKVEDLKKLLAQLKGVGIQSIEGNIIIDDTRFQRPDYAMGWSQDSLSWYYAAPITTVMLNENLIKLSLNSSKAIGEKAEIAFAADETIKPSLTQDISIVSMEEANGHCQIQIQLNEENGIFVSGCWPQKSSPDALKVALKNPNILAKKIILDYLVDERIVLKGRIITGSTPKNTPVVALHRSQPLRELLKPLLQDSNNLYADSLVKTLGDVKFQKGTFQMGVQAIKDTLMNKNPGDFLTVQLLDGSGLSRYNLVTPSQFSKVLLSVYHDNAVKDAFIEALPRSGESGTLKGRMDSIELKGKVKAKTGTMMNDSSLVGYLTTPSRKDLVVVILMDHIHDVKKARDLQDALCKQLLKL